VHLVLRYGYYNVTTNQNVIYVSDLSVRGLSYFYASCDGILELLYTRISVQLVVDMCPITSGQCCDGVEVGPHVFLFAVFFLQELLGCKSCRVCRSSVKISVPGLYTSH
jgi:hypothetical protein